MTLNQTRPSPTYAVRTNGNAALTAAATVQKNASALCAEAQRTVCSATSARAEAKGACTATAQSATLSSILEICASDVEMPIVREVSCESAFIKTIFIILAFLKF